MISKTSRFFSLGLSLALALGFASCDRVYDEPLLTEPESALTPNITISGLKEKYAAATQNKSLLIDTDYILRVRVGGNDESGNIYKTLWVQDETGGMPLAVDMSNMSAEYMVGQELLIKLKGLSVNVYGGVQQIGYKEEGSTNTRIPQVLFKTIAERNGYPDISKVEPLVVTLSGLKDDMIGKLVEFRDVAWQEPGEVFAVKDENTNRHLTDGSKTLIVRNSGYSLFAGDKLPEGIGTVRGILSKFGNDYQLFLRTKDDVFGFRPGTPSGSNPSTPSDPTPQPDPGAPSAQGADAILLFPGSDFETQADFGKYGLKDSAVKDGVGMKNSKGLHISGIPGGNNFVFSTTSSSAKADKTYTKISFWIKGTAAGKSLSVNVYQADGTIWGYNLGDVTSSKMVAPKKPTASDTFVNDYKGSIDTGGKWVLVTLDITGAKLNTSGSNNTFAIKDGKAATYDLVIDDIKIE